MSKRALLKVAKKAAYGLTIMSVELIPGSIIRVGWKDDMQRILVQDTDGRTVYVYDTPIGSTYAHFKPDGSLNGLPWQYLVGKFVTAKNIRLKRHDGLLYLKPGSKVEEKLKQAGYK